MTGVLLCGVLVAGCNAGEWEEPAHEQPGGTGTEASIGSTRQAITSPELMASLECVETYVNAGTCDWDHWSELWETCATYNHPALEDGYFLDEVQSGNCTAANWPTMREYLSTPRSMEVRLRESCNSSSQVIQGAEANGCYSLEPAAGASYVNVASGKAVTLHAGTGCTGDSVTVQSDASLCDTSFESGASADGNVQSFRIADAEVPPSDYNYTCAVGESECVRNYNPRLGVVNSTHRVNVVRVALAGKTTPSMSSIMANVHNMYDFFVVASRNQVHRNIIGTQTVQVTSSNCGKAKEQAVAQVSATAFMTVYVLPTGLCSISHATGGNIYLNDNLFRTYVHETGHILGLAHGNARDPSTNKPIEYRDASTFMGRFPSDNYNLPQLHWLGWTKKAELTQVNAVLERDRFTEVILRPVDVNANKPDSPIDHKLGAVWETPDGKNRLFIVVPKARLNSANDIEGGTVIVYRAPTCKLRADCPTVMVMGTLTLARFIATNTNVHAVFESPLKLSVVGSKSKNVQVAGKTVKEYEWVKLRIALPPLP
ncbi:hypothetical protein [Myxococcus sp. CA040A]|uniref:hypothetical protein n=1 Tax=Myxococcus sp. CA040A TaxID=2741738 RepID=UPI0020C5B4C4|nr:hypothetical protein [Myxococcus sp. CA040A]